MRPLKTGLTVLDAGRATPGFTLYSPLWRKVTYLLDMDGKIVHQWELPGCPGGYARLLPNGNLFYSTHTESGPPFPGGASGGLMREVDWDGNVIMEVRDDWQHHDCRRLENGNVLYAAWEEMPEDATKKVVGGVEGSEFEGRIFNDLLREVTPGGETVWEWHAYPDMEVENYPIHPLTGRRVFAWCNTCCPLPGGDVLIILRQINLVGIIDRESKRFKYEHQNLEWGHPHDAKMLENGNILMFANGMNTTAAHPHSYITEFDPKTNETVWEYKSDPTTFFYSHHISGCERLESGNTLICEGSFGRVFEVTPDGEIVWEFINPDFDKMFMGETVNWVFRAFRYAESSPEINGRVKL